MSDHFHDLSHPDATVTVRIGDTVVARSVNTILLKEVVGGRRLDPVYYFPTDDVEMGGFVPTATQTHCPIKGEASYWSYQNGDESLADVAWGYATPIEYSGPIAGRMAFDSRHTSIEVE